MTFNTFLVLIKRVKSLEKEFPESYNDDLMEAFESGWESACDQILADFLVYETQNPSFIKDDEVK